MTLQGWLKCHSEYVQQKDKGLASMFTPRLEFVLSVWHAARMLREFEHHDVYFHCYTVQKVRIYELLNQLFALVSFLF